MSLFVSPRTSSRFSTALGTFGLLLGRSGDTFAEVRGCVGPVAIGDVSQGLRVADWVVAVDRLSGVVGLWRSVAGDLWEPVEVLGHPVIGHVAPGHWKRFSVAFDVAGFPVVGFEEVRSNRVSLVSVVSRVGGSWGVWSVEGFAPFVASRASWNVLEEEVLVFWVHAVRWSSGARAWTNRFDVRAGELVGGAIGGVVTLLGGVDAGEVCVDVVQPVDGGWQLLGGTLGARGGEVDIILRGDDVATISAGTEGATVGFEVPSGGAYFQLSFNLGYEGVAVGFEVPSGGVYADTVKMFDAGVEGVAVGFEVPSGGVYAAPFMLGYEGTAVSFVVPNGGSYAKP